MVEEGMVSEERHSDAVHRLSAPAEISNRRHKRVLSA
jgi:hypothetical protein